MTDSTIKRCPDCGLISDDDALTTCPSDGASMRTYDPGDELIGRTLQGRFVVKRLLGRGGMGAVYLARQLSVDRDVAVKVLRVDVADNASRVRRFLREAKATSHLRSPHTVTVYDFGQADDGTLFLVMEHLEGRTLQGRITSDGPMSVHEALEFADGLADSLAEAHAAGIVHRDLKPANIFLARQGEQVDFPKVLDFGIAQAQAVDGGATITASNVIVGSVAYMSPEMIEGRQVDARADVYAVGIILWECLTGRRPFSGDTRFQLMQQHLHTVPPSLSEVLATLRDPHLPALSDLVDRCLDKRREMRPADGRELRRRIAGLLALARTDEVVVPSWDEGIGLEKTIDAGAASAASNPALASAPLSAPGGSSPDTPLQTGADTRPKPPTSSRGGGRWAWVAIAAVALAGVVVMSSPLLGPGHDDTGQPRTAPAGPATTSPSEVRLSAPTPGTSVAIRDDTDAAEALPRVVTLRLHSKPTGAEVVRGERVLGTTPFALELPQSTDRTRVTLRLDDHREHTLDLIPSKDDRVDVTLDPLRPALAPDAPETVAPGPRQTPKKLTTARRRGTVDSKPSGVNSKGAAAGQEPAPALKKKDEAAEVLLD